MIVDTSALIAVARREPDAERYIEALVDAEELRMSAATFVELGIVASLVHRDVAVDVDAMVEQLGISVEAVTLEQAVVAREASRRYGKGTRHPARLNYGDTFSYALAKTSGEPLLYKGDDFGHTDIRSALA